ncbi:glycosyltransferase [Agrilactobacillus yilanensis]|uniref:Glycosyltransferase n=1 Tax=Agrilactobacillus yilanensis TaxID=2485997 RepID=A0ABW4JAU8_9LACO|nr:glycosyltransferase [Agrilactobacillus yilanensis]
MQLNIVAGHLGGIGGTERVIVDFANGLSQRGYKINFYFMVDEISDDRWLLQISPSVTIHRVPAKNKLQKARSLFKLSQQLAGIVLVVNTRNLKFLTYLKRRFKRSYIVVSWIHTNLFSRSGYKAIPSADYHLAVSEGISQQLQTLGVSEDRIFVALDPVAEQKTTLPKSAGTEPVRLVYVGRMENTAKNIMGLLDTCAALTGAFQLDIYGDGPDLAAMKAYGKKLKLQDKVIWHGQVIDPWRVMPKADVLVLSSNYEGLALVLLEAMSYGVPCVAYDCPVGPAEIIQSGLNGYLIPLKDTAAFTQKVQLFVDRQTDFSDSLAIKRSIERFYRPAYFERLVSIFHEMAQRN